MRVLAIDTALAVCSAAVLCGTVVTPSHPRRVRLSRPRSLLDGSGRREQAIRAIVDGTVPRFRDWANWRDRELSAAHRQRSLAARITCNIAGGCPGFSGHPIPTFRGVVFTEGHAPLFLGSDGLSEEKAACGRADGTAGSGAEAVGFRSQAKLTPRLRTCHAGWPCAERRIVTGPTPSRC